MNKNSFKNSTVGIMNTHNYRNNMNNRFSFNDNPKMLGKKVLVTGAGTGVGQGIAIEFAREGADVMFHYYLEEKEVMRSIEYISSGKNHPRVGYLYSNFKELKNVKNLYDDSVRFLGGIDVLVNNAGITANIPFLKTTEEQYSKIFDVNMKAMYFLSQYAAKDMIKKDQTGIKGHIINLSSVHANFAMTEHSAYAATKGAIQSFTREIAVELAPKRVHVNAIAPGWCLVENHYKANPNLDAVKGAEGIPAGFISSPSDVGKLAVMLATDMSSYFVGQTLTFDGGQTAVLPGTGSFKDPRIEKWGRDYL